MLSTLTTGNPKPIHILNKEEVGEGIINLIASWVLFSVSYMSRMFYVTGMSLLRNQNDDKQDKLYWSLSAHYFIISLKNTLLLP